MVAVYGGTKNKIGNGFGVFFLFTFVTFYATCVDAISYVYCSEIFPTALRAQGVGFSIIGLFAMTLSKLPTLFDLFFVPSADCAFLKSTSSLHRQPLLTWDGAFISSLSLFQFVAPQCLPTSFQRQRGCLWKKLARCSVTSWLWTSRTCRWRSANVSMTSCAAMQQMGSCPRNQLRHNISIIQRFEGLHPFPKYDLGLLYVLVLDSGRSTILASFNHVH